MLSDIASQFSEDLEALHLPLEQIPISQRQSHLSQWIRYILLSINIRLNIKLPNCLDFVNSRAEHLSIDMWFQLVLNASVPTVQILIGMDVDSSFKLDVEKVRREEVESQKPIQMKAPISTDYPSECIFDSIESDPHNVSQPVIEIIIPMKDCLPDKSLTMESDETFSPKHNDYVERTCLPMEPVAVFPRNLMK
ncbi:hypothetical protein TNCV_5110401 [Trichonephila clavipes]|nr:hypothetical protein TNCV_5110401 [Trichonephila clavipes]